MFSVYLPSALAAIASSRRIRLDDLAVIDETIHADTAMMNDEIEWLSYLDRSCVVKDLCWHRFYVETTVDYVLRLVDEPGTVESERLSWLQECLSEDGMVQTAAGLEILIRLIVEARQVPEWLAPWVLNQVRAGIVFGFGPVGAGYMRPGAVVLAGDVAIIRRVLAGSRALAQKPLTRMEMDILFDINEQSDQGGNDPAWSDLFVKAAANFLVAGRGHRVPERAVALAPAEWLANPVSGTASIFRRLSVGLLPHSLEEFWRGYRLEPIGAAERAVPAIDGEIHWMIERMTGRGASLHENEKALLAFLSQETPDLHPSLAMLASSAA